MQTIMDASKIAETIRTLAGLLLEDPILRGLKDEAVALVGIRSGGELIAARLAEEIRARRNVNVPVGALDITMYRDDLATRRAITIPHGTDMNFRLDGRIVILIDDVLETGRSVRAALDALVDFGRPRLIRLAVLIDRGNREYPIAADYVGQKMAFDPRKKIVVHLRPTAPEDAVYLEAKGRAGA